MITRQSHCTVYVFDQDRARAFYVDKLGFEVRDDARMGEFRWLTVGPKAQPSFRIVLMPIAGGPGMDDKHREMMKELVKTGALGGGVLVTDNLDREYADLTAKGVEFPQPPTKNPWGYSAVLKDDSGNYFSISENDE
jgi:catechol 2,3-dioxygenase-like lactoylglutathione lyase family enzyme